MIWSPNLQLLYPFENQANDYSGNARHGTVNGSGVYATRPNGGRCLLFDGTGDDVTTPSFGLSGTVVWFAADVRCKLNATVSQFLLGDYTTNYMGAGRYSTTNTLSWIYHNGTSAVLAEVSDYFASPYNDAWLHLLIVCDYAGKNTYFYRNGIPFGTPVAMSGTPQFPSSATVKLLGTLLTSTFLLTDGYMANAMLSTLATMPPVAQVTANAQRMHLGLHPIW